MTQQLQQTDERPSKEAGRPFHEVFRLILIAVVYFVSVRGGLLFVAQPEGIASIWPPSGVALAALLLSNRDKWLPVLLTIFATNIAGNLTGGNSLPVSFGFALANILEPTLGAWVIIRFSGAGTTFTRVAEVLALCLAAVVMNACTALLGASVPTLAFGAPFLETWRLWWVADGLGILLITPVIVTWVKLPKMFRGIPVNRLAEGMSLLLAVAVIPWMLLSYSGDMEHPFFHLYIVFPLLIWSAFRFSQRTTSTLLLLFAATLLWRLLKIPDGFQLSDMHLKFGLLSIQILLIVTTLSGLILSTVVSERRQAQTALRESAERFRGIIEETAAGYFLLDKDGHFQDVNGAWLKMHRYTSKEEIIGRHFSVTQVETDIKAAEENVRSVIRGNRIPAGEFTRRCKDGSIGYHSFSIKPVVRTGKVIGLEGFIIDLTEKRELEAHLRQAQKLEAIGTMSGGIAHNFNNILSIILGNTELLMEDIPESTPARDNLEEIQTAAFRAREIVRQLLHFTHMTDPVREPVDIHDIVRETLVLLRSAIPSSIDMRHDIQEEPSYILADASQVKQMLINLCNNAAQAMPNGGLLEIAVKTEIPNAKVVHPNGNALSDRCIHLMVRDTGCGILPEHLERIFDPYYTTRGVGEGSGMGLAVVHGIVRKNGGTISVDSEVGKGTTFHVFFPVRSNNDPDPETPMEVPLQTEQERILLVDDEEAIVKITRQRLERLGYTVDSTTDAVEALERFRSDPDRFDLVITDLTMPRMTGEDLTQKILKIRRDIPVIVCTGFSDKIGTEKAKEIGATGYIQKPYDKRFLAQTVRKVLDKSNKKKAAESSFRV